jgi:hypothetical protein
MNRNVGASYALDTYLLNPLSSEDKTIGKRLNTRKPKMYSIFLKIKRLSLADESRRIRREEIKLKARGKASSGIFYDLYHHRTFKIRHSARAAHLAHAFLRGMKYSRVEHPNTKEPVPFDEVAKNVRSFGIKSATQNEMVKVIEEWVGGEVPVNLGASNPQSAGSTPVSASIV